MRAVTSGLFALCFAASLASAQEVALAPQGGDPGMAARRGAAVHIPLVQQLLADPDIRNHVGLAENNWDFSAPGGVPGFGPMPSGTTGLGPWD